MKLNLDETAVFNGNANGMSVECKIVSIFKREASVVQTNELMILNK